MSHFYTYSQLIKTRDFLLWSWFEDREPVTWGVVETEEEAISECEEMNERFNEEEK